jgi:hypothetical protein
MKRKYLTILLSFIFAICYSQQFSFIELTNMLESQQLYETNNIAKGNSVVNMRKYDDYSYTVKDGTFGVGRNYPSEYEGKFKSLVKSTMVQSDFAEGYDEENETAYTWYKFRTEQDIKNYVVDEKGPLKPSRKIYVYYPSKNDYLEIARQVNRSATYIGTKEKYGSYYSEYKYNGLVVKLEKSNDSDIGGTIEIIKGDFPW